MNKSVIYLLLFFSYFYSILGRDCTDFIKTKFNACRAIHLASENKNCIYLNDECKEQIADCELYSGNVATECESIIPKNDPLHTKCVYKNDKCQPKEITSCEEFNPLLPKQFCDDLFLNNGVRCHLVNNECKEYYSSCSVYLGNDKNICESIKIRYHPYRYCSYTDNGCEEKTKTGLTCDSYQSDQDSSYCEGKELEDKKIYCLIRDLNEKICTLNYKKCSDYKEMMKIYVILTFQKIIINIIVFIKMDNVQKKKKVVVQNLK